MSEAAASTSTAIPLAPLPDNVAARVRQAGVKQVNLYRALAHAPRLLEAWIDFSWALREHCETPRALRELIILRTAQLMLSPYEWHQHRRMAAEAGVQEYQVAELAMWRTSPAFNDAERAPSPSPTLSPTDMSPTKSTMRWPSISTSKPA